MAWNNDDFTAEAVDEQIEHSLQVRFHQDLNAVLTQEIQSMYEEDREMLERVWERYAARIGSMNVPTNAQPATFSWSNEGTLASAPVPSRTRSGRRTGRVFALVAVVLIAAVLVGSALWGVSALRQPGRNVATQTTATTQLAGTHTPTASTRSTGTPSTRMNFQAAYDDEMNALLLFGGQNYTGLSTPDDTWSWDGATWTQLDLHPVTRPGSRTGAVMAYDPATQQIVLFGGISASGNTPVLGDTWIWNGNNWVEQHPASSPPARTLASLAYDATSGQLVLFGGKHVSGFGPDLNDTWVWTGSNWIEQHPATTPPARTQASLVYDQSTMNLVLYGGDGFEVVLNDTWVWTGSNWVEQHPKTSPALSDVLQGQTVTFNNPSMIDNPATGKLLLTLIGESTNQTYTQATWTWDGSDWSEINVVGPAVETGYVFYDQHLQTIFEITSFLPSTSVTIQNKIWKWSGQSWVLVKSW